MSDLANKLKSAFHDREYREGYAAEFLKSWISQQVATLRKQRGLTQKELADLTGTKQSGIARMEREDYGRWNLGKLQGIAFALGCRLRVSMESFGSLVEDVAAFSPQQLQRPEFQDDPVFHDGKVWSPQLADPGPIGEMSRKLIPWLESGGELAVLANWLDGYDLPLPGNDPTPAKWLLLALPPKRPELRANLAAAIRRATIELRHSWIDNPSSNRPIPFFRNLMDLIAGLRQPELLDEVMWRVQAARSSLPIPWIDHDPWHPIVPAMIYNQQTEAFRPTWQKMLAGGEASSLEGRATRGMLGFSYSPTVPNSDGIAEAAQLVSEWSIDVAEQLSLLETAMLRIWKEFDSTPRFPFEVVQRVINGKAIGWSRVTVSSWAKTSGNLSGYCTSDECAQIDGILRMANHASFARP